MARIKGALNGPISRNADPTSFRFLCEDASVRQNFQVPDPAWSWRKIWPKRCVHRSIFMKPANSRPRQTINQSKFAGDKDFTFVLDMDRRNPAIHTRKKVRIETTIGIKP